MPWMQPGCDGDVTRRAAAPKKVSSASCCGFWGRAVLVPSKARWHQQPLLGASGQHQPLAPTALRSRSEQAPKNVGAGIEIGKTSKAERCCEKPLKAENFLFFFFLSLSHRKHFASSEIPGSAENSTVFGTKIKGGDVPERPITRGSGPRQPRWELPLDLFSLYGNFCLGKGKSWGKKI